MEGGHPMTHPAVERSTRLGRVRGFERLGVETYRGLRYAEPAQRFRASIVNTRSWDGTFDATRFGAVPAQGPISREVYGPAEGFVYSEDCLFLNIHVPKSPSSLPHPVIVFIHGGSFSGGSGNCYDGTALALGADAVVVAINYRLGVFAAFDLEWLGTERDGGGQLWLGDQIAALEWIRDNIADYGGDPNLVTVIGESAGALSVAALCAAPTAEGLVHRAVACSTGYILNEPSRDVVAVVAKARRCTREQAIAWMKSAATADFLALAKRGKPLSPQPVANTPLLPGTMEQLIARRGAKAVPMIAGYLVNEGVAIDRMFKLATGWPALLRTCVGHVVAQGIAAHGARGRANSRAYLKRLARSLGIRGFGAAFNDAVWTDGFRRGAVDYLQMTKAAGSRGWLYVMDIPMRFAGELIPSSHGLDVALTFNVGDDPQATVPAFAEHPGVPDLARCWVRMLGHFARTGEPGSALGSWPEYEPRRRASLRVAGEGCTVREDVEKIFRENVWC
jgi:para-nitrobenzyl esterase